MMRAKPPSFKSDDSDVEELIQLKADCKNVLHGRPPFFRYLSSDEIFYRPAEVHLLKGDYSKGKKILGWKPTVSFKELVKMMVETDLKHLSK
jgi:GDP-D-mannose dehydratase